MTREEALRHRKLNEELNSEREKLSELRAKMYAPNTSSFAFGPIGSGYRNSQVETVALRAAALEDRIYELEREIFREYIKLVNYSFGARQPLHTVLHCYLIDCLEWHEIVAMLDYKLSEEALRGMFNRYFKKQEQRADEEVMDV